MDTYNVHWHRIQSLGPEPTNSALQSNILTSSPHCLEPYNRLFHMFSHMDEDYVGYYMIDCFICFHIWMRIMLATNDRLFHMFPDMDDDYDSYYVTVIDLLHVFSDMDEDYEGHYDYPLK